MPIGELVDSDPLGNPGTVRSVVEGVDRKESGVEDVPEGEQDLLTARFGIELGGLDPVVEHRVYLAVNDGLLVANEELVSFDAG